MSGFYRPNRRAVAPTSAPLPVAPTALDPSGCAACERGDGFAGKEYAHTGFGAGCLLLNDGTLRERVT